MLLNMLVSVHESYHECMALIGGFFGKGDYARLCLHWHYDWLASVHY